MFSVKNILLVVVLAALLGAGVWVGMRMSKADPAGPSEYSMITMANGDVYFGKLTWFPRPKLTSVWILQRSVDEKNQVQVGLMPFSEVTWKPVNELYLNKKHILTWTSLQEGSELVKALRDPSSAQRIPQDQLPAPSQSAPQSSTPSPETPAEE